MADHLTPEQRSWNMAQIKGKETMPEVLVRSLLHRAGYRFRKNVKGLPGKPDIVLPRYRTVIFVHGCFWHRHKGCRYATTPSTNKTFWKKKFERNIANDKKHTRHLRKLGWYVIIVWECQLKKPKRTLRKLTQALTATTLSLLPKKQSSLGD